MERISVKAFTEGQKIVTSLLITQLTKGVTTSGAPYVSFIFSDKSGTIDGKMWDVKEEQLNLVDAGKVVSVNAEVLKYRNALQLRVFSISPMDESEYEAEDYVRSSHLSQLEMKTKLDQILASMKDPIYHDICLAIVTEFEDRLYSAPAAAKNHHEFAGGLVTHMISMSELADALCKLYPQLNRDLLLGGVLLHDMGKTIELSGPILTEYTLEGKLIGHISIMESKVSEIAKKLNVGESEQALLLRHLILSHHGQYEYGSPVLPMVMEAEILNYVDNIDARMNMFDKALENVNEGEWTPRIFALENRPFYKPKNK